MTKEDGDEELRDVPGQMGQYGITRKGEVYSYRWKRFMKCTPLSKSSKYHTVRLGGTNVYIHKVVMSAWVGPCPEGMQVDHVDRDPSNNHVSNLRYVSPRENAGNRVTTLSPSSPSPVASVRKEFDVGTYNKWDTPACGAVSTYLLAQGVYTSRNSDKYGPDIVVYSGLRGISYVEVEVKVVWKSGQEKFPWSTVHLPERKSKFLRMHKPVDFWLLREDLRKAVVVPGKQVKGSPLVEVPNRYVAEGEKFYKVEIGECVVLDLVGPVDTIDTDKGDGNVE